MPNNIIRHVEYGFLDLRKPDLGRPDIPFLWQVLCQDTKRPVEQRGLMCGEICSELGRVEWMHVYEKRDGHRIAAHQSREANRWCGVNETDEHKAYKERTIRVAEVAGHRAEAEVRSPDGAVRTDVLITGADGRRVGFEIQRSSVAPQTVTKRDRAALTHGINAAWHTDRRDLAQRNEVAWTRTDNLSPAAITDGRDLLIRGGIQNLTPYRCDSSAPLVCPKSGRGRCGAWHFTPTPLAMHYDDYVRGVAAGELVKVSFRLSRRVNLFWTPAADRDRYEGAAEVSVTGRALPRPRQPFPPTGGNATCRDRPRVEVEDIPEAPRAAVSVMPPPPRMKPVKHACGAGVTPCGASARLFPCGWRCDTHKPGLGIYPSRRSVESDLAGAT